MPPPLPPPGVTGEVYSFPCRQLIFSFGRHVMYHLKGLWEYIPKLIPSVCASGTTIFKRIAGLCFYPKSFDVTNQWIRLDKLYKNKGKLCSNFEFVFELLAENWKIFKLIDRREYWWNCNVLFINGFVSTCSKNLWKFFFLFSESFSELTTIFLIIVALGLCMWGGGGICADQHTFYSKTSLIRTPLNRNSAKPNKPILRTSFYLNRTNFG